MDDHRLDLCQVRAIVTDADVLGRIDPAAVAAYLTRSGWIRAHERAGGAIWTRWVDDSAVKVFVRTDQAVADFALRMGTLLAALAVAEDRSQLAVLVDLCGAAPMPSAAELDSLRRENQRLRDQLDVSAGHSADECEADAIQAEYDALQRPAERVEAAARRATTANDTSAALVELEAVLDEGAALATAPADEADEGHACPEATA